MIFIYNIFGTENNSQQADLSANIQRKFIMHTKDLWWKTKQNENEYSKNMSKNIDMYIN